MERTLKYISNCFEDNIDEVKLSLLFSDKIEVYDDQDFVLTSKPIEEVKDGEEIDIEKDGYWRDRYISNDFRSHIKILVDEGVVKLIKEFPDLGGDELWSKIKPEAQKLIKENYHFILFEKLGDFYINNGEKYFNAKLIDEAQKVYNQFVPDFNFVFYYYRRLLTILIRESFTGTNCYTSSNVLNKFLKIYYSKKSESKENQLFLKEHSLNPQIAFNTLQVNLPNISKLSFEDILELKEKSKDEIQRFVFELEKLEFEVQHEYSPEYLLTNAKDIVKYKVQPSVDDLVRKMTGGDFKFLKTFISELKDPKSYSPLLTTVFGNVPSHLAILCSTGFVSISTLFELIEKKRETKELKQNGYYFLIDMKRKFQ